MKLRQAIKIAKSVCAKEWWNRGYDDVVKPSSFALSYNRYQISRANARLRKRVGGYVYYNENRALNKVLREEMGA